MSELAIRVKERFNEFISQSGLSVAAFEKKCGLSNGYVRNFKGNFGIAKLEDILTAFPLLNKEWLLYGTGEMLKSSKNQPETPTVEQPEEKPMTDRLLFLIESQKKDIETLIQLVKEKDEKINELLDELNARKKDAAPRAGLSSSVNAG